MLKIALMAMGGSHWIAGSQYLQSILFGNSLLPRQERAALRLYVDPEDQDVSDYRPVHALSEGVYATNFSSAPRGSFYQNLRKMARTVLRKHRWPAMPTSTLSRALKKHGTDVLFAGPRFQSGITIPQICWIPDFQHIYRPEFFSAEERQRRDSAFAKMMNEAAAVIVSNQCSYNDAVELYPENRGKLSVLPFTMYLGRSCREVPIGTVLSKYHLPAKFLLLPSQFWKHKNHGTVFRAVQLMRGRGATDVTLVCTGLAHDPRFPEYAAELQTFIQSHGLETTIRVLGLIPRSDQVQLMRTAAAVIQPSLFEGWSAVLEEGRSLGKRIFASDIPMHREQQSERVHLFDPKSAEGLADLLYRHWRELTPGPQVEWENAAEAEYYCRIREFGRHFVTLCGSVKDAA